jgi:hypothetical protein
MNVRLSAWNNLGPIWRIFMKFGVWIFFRKLLVSLKSYKNSWYFTWLPKYIWSDLVEFFLEWAIFQTKIAEKTKRHILCVVTFFPEIHTNYEIMRTNAVEPGRLQIIYDGACTLHPGYLRLKLHTQCVLYVLLFHCKGCMNAHQCFVTVHCLLSIICLGMKLRVLR